MANKTQYAQRGRELSTVAANLFDQVLAWRDVYWDRAYNGGGTDELTNEDVAVTGVTAADVTGMVTFADALETFLVSNRAYLSKMRNDL
jgi:hypothetical protein